ncbi:SIR2 family protein [Nannocystis radixulma]|uniref:SIR2-like domain-containing protein n=1 Tax=Nannocystis radixulma TaxID=2995305 RepID=A0ABT5BA82_9BACT|nr:SIR2 family protein [Nannocystis radixulma]MDC0671040.1 hypothetical protein [Nannocystis radixulma]
MSVAEPEEWGPEGLCEQFWDVDRKMHNRRFAFILGAGASVQSGIPAAGALVWRWLTELHRRLSRHGPPLERWATAEALEIADFALERAPSFYSQVFARRFRQHPDEGYADLEDIMQGKDPSFGYSVLAHILAETRHKLVITTNFDNLVSEALSIFTGIAPLVCGHESLANFVHVEPRRPVVVKIHRDLLMAPMNRVAEIAALQSAWVEPLTKVFRSYTPIVIGYGGNDGSLMGFLNSLPEDSIPGGIFWCYYGPAGPPAPEIRHLVARHRGILVPIEGFDELMLRLSARLRIPLLDQVIESKARARVDNYRRRVEELQARLFPPAPAEARPAVAGEAEPAAEPAETLEASREEPPPPPVLSARSIAPPPVARRDNEQTGEPDLGLATRGDERRHAHSVHPGASASSPEPRPIIHTDEPRHAPPRQPGASARSSETTPLIHGDEPCPAPSVQPGSSTRSSEPRPIIHANEPRPAPSVQPGSSASSIEPHPAPPRQHAPSASAPPHRGLEVARTPSPEAAPSDRSPPTTLPHADAFAAGVHVGDDTLLALETDAMKHAEREHPEAAEGTSESSPRLAVTTAPRGWTTGPLVRVPVRDAPLQRALLQLTGDAATHSPWTLWMQARAEPNREKALALLHAALDEFPDNDLLTLGIAERVADPPTSETVTLAVQAISNVLRQDRDNEAALWHLALLLAWRGDFPRAIDVLERAARLAGDRPRARAAVVAFLWGLLARLQDLDDERALAQFKRRSEGLTLRTHPPRALVTALTSRLEPASQRLYTHLFQRLAGTLSEAELLAEEPRFAAIEPAPADPLE